MSIHLSQNLGEEVVIYFMEALVFHAVSSQRAEGQAVRGWCWGLRGVKLGKADNSLGPLGTAGCISGLLVLDAGAPWSLLPGTPKVWWNAPALLSSLSFAGGFNGMFIRTLVSMPPWLFRVFHFFYDAHPTSAEKLWCTSFVQSSLCPELLWVSGKNPSAPGHWIWFMLQALPARHWFSISFDHVS